MDRKVPVRAAIAALILGSVFLAGCESRGRTAPLPEEGPGAREAAPPQGPRRAFARGSEPRTATVRVNNFAWRASLDSIGFMPLRTSDPYGGVIATDWYSAEDNPGERIRVNIQVSGPELRSDTVRVSVFRETRDARGNWQPAKVAENTAQDLENVILGRARDLRNQAG